MVPAIYERIAAREKITVEQARERFGPAKRAALSVSAQTRRDVEAAAELHGISVEALIEKAVAALPLPPPEINPGA